MKAECASPKRTGRFTRPLSPNFCSSITITLIGLMLYLVPSVNAQSLTVLHTFTSVHDGAHPFGGVTLDPAGNLYGTAADGALGYGTIFKLTRGEPSWVLTTLRRFHGSDGADPESPLILGPDGAVYGTTRGGGQYGAGTIFRLEPMRCSGTLCPWTETVLYDFARGRDGSSPLGHLIFDQAGRMYGTSAGMHVYAERGEGGGPPGCVWQLVHSNVSWTFQVVHAFSNYGGDGTNPKGGVLIDRDGNLYGTTPFGGSWGWGTVFEMTPVGQGWSEQILHSFSSMGGGGSLPEAGLVADQSGSLFGATFVGGYAFEMTLSGSVWSFNTIAGVSNADGPYSDLTIDAQGNLYGATIDGGRYGQGNVFQLTRSNGVWTYRNLYDFMGAEDGSQPFGSVIVDSAGAIYGTTAYGGHFGDGTVWMLRQ